MYCPGFLTELKELFLQLWGLLLSELSCQGFLGITSMEESSCLSPLPLSKAAHTP